MSVATEARRDLIQKLNLEQKLAREISKINNKITAGTIKSFNDSGLSFDASTLEVDLADTLNEHYQKTTNVFASQLIADLPDDILATVDEETLIQESLALYMLARAADQAAIITKTNQKNVDDSVVTARQSRDDDDKPLSHRDQARAAGVLTARKLRTRLQGIATTETQNAAETAKGTAVEVLAGRTPSIVRGSPSSAGVPKEWVTVGDEKVRMAHVVADSQVVDLSKPFTVDGQLLRWPGDTALGATVANVINCRCSSVYDAQAVFAIRRRKAQEAFTETTPSAQLLESMG